MYINTLSLIKKLKKKPVNFWVVNLSSYKIKNIKSKSTYPSNCGGSSSLPCKPAIKFKYKSAAFNKFPLKLANVLEKETELF